MAPFLYRCPNTGQKVQGFVADDPTDGDDDDTYAFTVTDLHRLSSAGTHHSVMNELMHCQYGRLSLGS